MDSLVPNGCKIVNSKQTVNKLIFHPKIKLCYAIEFPMIKFIQNSFLPYIKSKLKNHLHYILLIQGFPKMPRMYTNFHEYFNFDYVGL
jgi:hypothetical protein